MNEIRKMSEIVDVLEKFTGKAVRGQVRHVSEQI